MCAACNAPFWLDPRRSAADELAFQQARLAGGGVCPRCTELALEIEALEDELRVTEEYYLRDIDPDEL